MVDDQHFVSGMAALAGAFGREIDGPITKLYFNILAPHMTNDEWTLAVERTCATEKFWPAPAVILEKIRPTIDGPETAWQAVVDALNQHGGYRFLPSEISMGWDAQTWAGIKAIGGLAEITNCTEERWKGIAKKFRDAYVKAGIPQVRVTAGEKPDPRVARLVADTSQQLSLESGREKAIPTGDR